MDYKIIISKRAEKNLDAIFKYLEKKWPEKVKNDFKLKLLREVDFLRQNPFMFPESLIKKNMRRCLITKHNVMYFRIKKNEVEIITIHDTRKKPKSLKLQFNNVQKFR